LLEGRTNRKLHRPSPLMRLFLSLHASPAIGLPSL
jgi:hypothetical protein